MVCFTGLTWLQLLVGQCQSLDHCGGNQLCNRVRAETLSSDEGLGFPETFWLLRKQQFLQNGSWFLAADLSEGKLQLLKGNIDVEKVKCFCVFRTSSTISWFLLDHVRASFLPLHLGFLIF